MSEQSEGASTRSVVVRDHGGWREITLNRPDRRNAFNEEMQLSLRAALHDASRDEACRALLLTGAGKGFCAGQDLAERDPAKNLGAPDLSHTLTTFYHPIVRLIRDCPKPVICAVNGVAAGAGANLALACDIVLAAESASFIQVFSRIGLVPDCGGAWLLARALGEGRAKALAMTAEPLPARAAQECGLVFKVWPDDELMEQARALAASMANGPTQGYALTKQLVHAAASTDFEGLLALEAEMQGRAGRTPDYAEGVRAFFEKRPPNYSGKA